MPRGSGALVYDTVVRVRERAKPTYCERAKQTDIRLKRARDVRAFADRGTGDAGAGGQGRCPAHQQPDDTRHEREAPRPHARVSTSQQLELPQYQPPPKGDQAQLDPAENVQP